MSAFLASLGLSDSSRITSIPRRDSVPPEALSLAEGLRVEGGTWTLTPAQAQVLYDLQTYGSALGLVTVGGGKTLIASLAGVVAQTGDRTALLVPPDLAKAFQAEYDKYEAQFAVERPTLLRYSMLSSQKGLGMLDAHDPDLLILDEGHYVRRKDAARTRRLLSWLKARRQSGRPVRLVVLSGTLIRSTILDLGWFCDEVLGERSPLPKAYSTRQKWSRVIDRPKCAEDVPDYQDYRAVASLCEWAGQPLTVEGAREAWRLRLSTTPGVTCTSGASCDASIVLHRRTMAFSAEAYEGMRDRWVTPCGAEEVEPTQVAAQLARLAWGYYYVWDWGEDGPDYEWLEIRAEYYCQSRLELAKRPVGIDTQGLLERQQGPQRRPGVECWFALRWEWLEALTRRPQPPTRVVWVDEGAALRAAIASAPKDSLIWYADKGQEQIARESGLRFYPPGSAVDLEHLASTDEPVLLSMNSHQKGWNLQSRRRMVVLSPSSGAAKWEQLLGRVHRQGQESDRIDVEVYNQAILKKRLDVARDSANVLQATGGGRQRLSLATIS